MNWFYVSNVMLQIVALFLFTLVLVSNVLLEVVDNMRLPCENIFTPPSSLEVGGEEEEMKSGRGKRAVLTLVSSLVAWIFCCLC